MQIDLKCANCGGNRFDYPFALKDNSVIKCSECGRSIGTVADIRAKVIKALTERPAPDQPRL